jgi:hypothetical protein
MSTFSGTTKKTNISDIAVDSILEDPSSSSKNLSSKTPILNYALVGRREINSDLHLLRSE